MYGETTYYRPEAMYCRRRAAEGAFGAFVHAEGEYFHPFDSPGCDLCQVLAARRNSPAGREHDRLIRDYEARGIRGGPMHYPTHSTAGPMCVMRTHAVKVCAWGQRPHTTDPYFAESGQHFSNETALFQMSNGATMRICEHREIGHPGSEIFRIYGTKASFSGRTWFTNSERMELKVEEMRDPLPPEVAAAWRDARTNSVAYGGHGGSHAYLVHEFVDAVASGRRPAISVWDAVRYTAAGAVAHKSALADGEVLRVPDWGDPPTA